MTRRATSGFLAWIVVLAAVPATQGCTRGGGGGGATVWVPNRGATGGDSVGSGGDATPVSDAGATNSGDDSGSGPGTDAGDGDAALDTGPEIQGEACGSHKVCLQKAPDTPYCHPTAKVCVHCLVDFHCASTTNHCENGTCTKLSCKPGFRQCKGDFVQTCNAAGSGFELQVCPDDKPSCQAGKCLKCKPNEVYCKKADPGGQSIAVMKCNAAGTSSDILNICPGQQVCHEGKCGLCVPGAKQCSGHSSQVCAADGGKWETFADCGAKGLTCLGGLCVNPCSGDFKSNTHVGCDYWAVDLDNALEKQGSKVYDAQNAQFSVVIANTSDAQAEVTVTSRATGTKQSKTLQVKAKGLLTINLPNVLGVSKPASFNLDGSGITKRTYHIQADQPIIAYQFNPLQNYGVFSNDASLLLPTSTLGKKYYVVSREQLGNKYRSYFTVVATAPGPTQVDVWVTTPTLGGGAVKAMAAGTKYSYTLQQGEVLNVESNKEKGDLTGSVILADKAVAVWGGSEASNSPSKGNCTNYKSPFGGTTKKVCASTTLANGLGKSCSSDAQCDSACCADHLEEQLFPVKVWGVTYIGAHLRRRGKERDAWRIVASANGTVVQVSPALPGVPATISLNEGQKPFEFETDRDFVLRSNHPILVAQYMASSYATVQWESPKCSMDAQCKSQWGYEARCTSAGLSKVCAPIGDPSLLLDIATSQYLTDTLFLVPDKYKLNFITVVTQFGTQVTLDGLSVAAGQFQAITASKWSVARLPISAGKHRIQASKPVGVWVYGYDDDVSYGYAAGARLGSAP